MKILRGRRRLDDLNVVLRREREKSFQPRAGMFRPHALKSVRQQQHESRQPTPFGFRAGDELINDDLRGVHEIAELCLPKHERFRAIKAVTIFKTERAGFAERAVENFHGRLFGREMLQRHERMSVLLIVKNRVALAECAASGVLPGQANPHAGLVNVASASASAADQSSGMFAFGHFAACIQPRFNLGCNGNRRQPGEFLKQRGEFLDRLTGFRFAAVQDRRCNRARCRVVRE